MMLLNLSLAAFLCFASGYADKCAPSVNPPEQNSGCCGVSVYDNKKIPGFFAALEQYPWMGLVEYKKGEETKIYCSAILISNRYTLSAAQCFTVSPVMGTPINIRLGDYDITNEGPDCLDEAEGKYCNDGAITIPIEKTIIHPGYRSVNRRSKAHDIALIKLKETAPYTDFIRPICLPASDVTLAATTPPRFILAGWGSVNDTHSLSNILHQVDLPFVDTATCSSVYNKSRSGPLGDGQLCAGGEGKDACYGDSGAPLMYKHDDNTFELAGIVSFGASPCGRVGKPGGYTKVFAYIDWIRENTVE